MTWGAIVAGVVSAGAGVYNASRARRDAREAGNSAAETADPFGNLRPTFQNMLMEMFPQLTDFSNSAFEESPGYQYEVGEMTEATDNMLGSQRLLRSGTRPIALSRMRSGLAEKHRQQWINNKMGMLTMLANLGGANVGNPAAAGQLQYGGFQDATNLQNSGINAVTGALPLLANGWNAFQRNRGGGGGGYYDGGGAGTPGGNWDSPG